MKGVSRKEAEKTKPILEKVGQGSGLRYLDGSKVLLDLDVWRVTTSVGCDWRGRGSPRRSGGARVVAPVAKPIVESGACERVCDSIIRNVMSPEGVASMMLLRNRKPTLLFGRTHGNRRA